MAISNFFNLAVCAEIAALLASLLLLRNERPGYWRLFILFLAATLFIEGAGFYFLWHRKPNYPLYNFLMLIQAAFFLFLFFRFHASKRIRMVIMTALAAIVLFFIVEGTVRSFNGYHKYSRLFLSVLVVLFSCTFFFSILKEDAVESPIKHPPFWIVTGLFFYYFGTAAMFAFYDRVSQIKLAGTISFYNLVMGCLCCILYGSWIIGFLWKKQIPSFKQ